LRELQVDQRPLVENHRCVCSVQVGTVTGTADTFCCTLCTVLLICERPV